MKNKNTHKFSVALSNNDFESLKKLAASKHITQSELIRKFIKKSLSIEAYTNEQDLIRQYIREELEEIIDKTIERLIRLQLKATQSAATTMFANICMLSDICADDADFENLLANSLKQAHIYMKQKEQPFEEYLKQAKEHHKSALKIRQINDM
ncbi:MAG: hypothetical protein FWH05_01075 [Oscillospiraceae bacterium]|nr:hypothetical protein [Oscillospiraceae bacterium]